MATGFFRPAAYASLPNLVPDDELTNANSLIQVIETLAWMVGPVVGALMVAVWGPDVPYAVNAVTFLFSAVLVAGISESRLRSPESLTRGHWRDVADGLRLVFTTAPLRTVLIVWNVVLLGSAAINVAEIFLAKDVLKAGDVGFGILVAASGVGLALGSYLAAPALGKVGLRRHYAGSIVLMGVGWGGAALAPTLWVAVPLDHRRRRRERRGDHLQPAARPARRDRPLSRPGARDDHELELRDPRPRHGRCGGAHRVVRARAQSGLPPAASSSSRASSLSR